MNFKYLEAFYFTVNERSISKAAACLGLTQPAVSNNIKKLEKYYGKIFLERSNAGIIITENGKLLYEKCEEIFKNLDQIEESLGRDNSKISGEIRIGTSDEISSYLLPMVVSKLKETYPDVIPEIVTQPAYELLEGLKKGTFDFLLLFYTPDLPEGVSEKKIKDIPFKMTVKSQHRRRKAILNNFIGSRKLQLNREKKFPALKRHKQNYPESCLYLSSNCMNTILQFTLNGDGVSILPNFMTDPLIKSKKLCDIYPKENFSYGLKVLMRNNFVPNKAHKLIIENL